MASLAAWGVLRSSALRLALSRPGVIGVDFGFVYKDRRRLKTRGVRFHVIKKRAVEAVPVDELLPKNMRGIRCDVVEARYGLAGSPREVCDPLEPGVSIGSSVRPSGGTLGLLVLDKQQSRRALLSNWHVLCGSPSATAGDGLTQPASPFLGTRPPRIVGRLERWIPLNVGLDAAIGLVDDGFAIRQAGFDGGQAIVGVAGPCLGMKVLKYGAVSGLTHAEVEGVGGAYEIDYSGYGDEKRWMDGIRLVQDSEAAEPEITLSGDSGSAWIESSTGHAVALHFAGEDGLGPTSEYALAQPLPRLMELLDIEFLKVM